jgi:hypothetical protein
LDEMENGWRPRTATQVPLDDRQLAQLGLLAAMETTCFTHLTTALKALDQLSYDEWKALDTIQFRQVADRLRASAKRCDDTLLSMVDSVIAKQGVLVLRHQHLHSLWANGPDNDITAWDVRRDTYLPVGGLTEATEKVAEFTYRTKDIMFRVVDLIVYGDLPERGPGPGPQVYWRGEWRRL